jgi:hypothetical protein
VIRAVIDRETNIGKRILANACREMKSVTLRFKPV